MGARVHPELTRAASLKLMEILNDQSSLHRYLKNRPAGVCIVWGCETEHTFDATIHMAQLFRRWIDGGDHPIEFELFTKLVFNTGSVLIEVDGDDQPQTVQGELIQLFATVEGMPDNTTLEELTTAAAAIPGIDGAGEPGIFAVDFHAFSIESETERRAGLN